MAEAHVAAYKRVDGRFGWRLVHRNGDILAGDQNQGYENESEAITIGNRVTSGHYLRDDEDPDPPPVDEGEPLP